MQSVKIVCEVFVLDTTKMSNVIQGYDFNVLYLGVLASTPRQHIIINTITIVNCSCLQTHTHHFVDVMLHCFKAFLDFCNLNALLNNNNMLSV